MDGCEGRRLRLGKRSAPKWNQLSLSLIVAIEAKRLTNSLVGPVSNAVSGNRLGDEPAGKRKQNGNAVATSSSDRGPAVASKVSPARSP
jgi:hypothetical protein